MKNFNEERFDYLNKIKTETLLAYGVYQVEAEGLGLFEYIKGDHNSIMVCLLKILSIILGNIKNEKIRLLAIKHSLSPVLHTTFNKYKIDASYSIIEIENSEFPDLMNKIKDKDLAGINIIPYKQKLFHMLILLMMQITRSINTIYLDDKGTIIGENTDVFGLQAAYLKEVDNITKKSAWVIGAGGVSPSVILSLEKSGVKNISITNRTEEKCIFLKKKFKFLKIISWLNIKKELRNYDIIINATSLGLKNGQDFNLLLTKLKMIVFLLIQFTIL